MRWFALEEDSNLIASEEEAIRLEIGELCNAAITRSNQEAPEMMDFSEDEPTEPGE